MTPIRRTADADATIESKTLLTQKVEGVDRRVDKLAKSVDERFDQVDQRFDEADRRVDMLARSVDERFDKVDEQFAAVREEIQIAQVATVTQLGQYMARLEAKFDDVLKSLPPRR